MKKMMKTMGVVALAVASALPALAQNDLRGEGQILVTVLPKKGMPAPMLTADQIKLKINGKDTNVTSVVAPKEADNIELVLLFDSSLRTSLGTQFEEITKFVNTLPPNVKVAIAYMQNGAAVFATPLTNDHAAVVKGLHLPGGVPGASASPYFCISDLAKRWPQGSAARREVLMVTDGVDNYSPRFDPEDPYVQAAIKDSIRAGIVLYSLYWRDQGRFARSRYANYSGQNQLVQTTEATGGINFWNGFTNPVSFEPYLEELFQRMQNQYVVSFAAPMSGKPSVESIRFKANLPGAQVSAPQQVYIAQSGLAQN